MALSGKTLADLAQVRGRSTQTFFPNDPSDIPQSWGSTQLGKRCCEVLGGLLLTKHNARLHVELNHDMRTCAEMTRCPHLREQSL